MEDVSNYLFDNHTTMLGANKIYPFTELIKPVSIQQISNLHFIYIWI